MAANPFSLYSRLHKHACIMQAGRHAFTRVSSKTMILEDRQQASQSKQQSKCEDQVTGKS
eukprot:scaffold4009_cov124-Cylindrotheca_fusiformis.AAC.5